MILSCFKCNVQSGLPFTIAVDRYDVCGKCGHNQQTPMKFYFCSLTCSQAWMSEAFEKKGIPCLDCRQSGFAFGHEANGPCMTCKGTKIFKVDHDKES